jgi:hypothetical protein
VHSAAASFQQSLPQQQPASSMPPPAQYEHAIAWQPSRSRRASPTQQPLSEQHQPTAWEQPQSVNGHASSSGMGSGGYRHPGAPEHGYDPLCRSGSFGAASPTGQQLLGSFHSHPTPYQEAWQQQQQHQHQQQQGQWQHSQQHAAAGARSVSPDGDPDALKRASQLARKASYRCGPQACAAPHQLGLGRPHQLRWQGLGGGCWRRNLVAVAPVACCWRQLLPALTHTALLVGRLQGGAGGTDPGQRHAQGR